MPPGCYVRSQSPGHSMWLSIRQLFKALLQGEMDQEDCHGEKQPFACVATWSGGFPATLMKSPQTAETENHWLFWDTSTSFTSPRENMSWRAAEY